MLRIQKEINNLKSYLNRTVNNKISKEIKINSALKFQKNNKDLLNKNIQNSINNIKESFWDLSDNVPKDKENIEILNRIYELIKELNHKDIEKNIDSIIEIEDEINKIKTIPDIKINLNLENVSGEIRNEILTDFNEAQKSFINGNYRSSIILCGRVLEICLHRKYFELTDIDILEKNPGIGLGTLIAKLQEKNIKFDPGVTQQIHLINQTRIHSVHIKKETFYPTRAQSQAILLLTQDILEKLF